MSEFFLKTTNKTVKELVLTPLKLGDKESISICEEILLDPFIHNTLSIAPVDKHGNKKPSKEILEKFVKIFCSFDEKLDLGMYAVREKSTKKLVGISGIVLSYNKDSKKATTGEVCYLIKKSFSGKKICTDLSRYFVKHAFAKDKLPTIYSCALVTNVPSNVILLKSGLKFVESRKRPNGNIVNYFFVKKENFKEDVDEKYKNETVKTIVNMDVGKMSKELKFFIDEFSE